MAKILIQNSINKKSVLLYYFNRNFCGISIGIFAVF